MTKTYSQMVIILRVALTLFISGLYSFNDFMFLSFIFLLNCPVLTLAWPSKFSSDGRQRCFCRHYAFHRYAIHAKNVIRVVWSVWTDTLHCIQRTLPLNNPEWMTQSDVVGCDFTRKKMHQTSFILWNTLSCPTQYLHCYLLNNCT